MKKSIAMMCLLLLALGSVGADAAKLPRVAKCGTRASRVRVTTVKVPRVRTGVALPLTAAAASELAKSKRQREEQAKRLTQRHFPTLQKPYVLSRSSLSPIDFKSIAPVTVAVPVISDTLPDAAPER